MINKKTKLELEEAGFTRLENHFPVGYFKVSDDFKRVMIYQFAGCCDGKEMYVRKYDGEFSRVKSLLQEMRRDE